MAQIYLDGADLPYRVVYSVKGRSSSQEVRFSEPVPAHQEVQKLVQRGHTVNFDVWSPASKCYITKDRYN